MKGLESLAASQKVDFTHQFEDSRAFIKDGNRVPSQMGLGCHSMGSALSGQASDWM